MKIIITGASGFIGNNIASALIKANHEVVTIGRTSPSNLSSTHVHFDLTSSDYSPIHPIIKGDILIHCSFIMASLNNTEDLDVLHKNLNISESIINISEILSIKHLINLSSIAVYPNTDGVYSETSQLNTSSNNDCIYGLSKLCAENIFDFFLAKVKQKKVTNLRISQVYGEGMREDRTYSIMKKELENENKITVWNNGERVSNFINIDKIIRTIKFFIANPDEADTYNLGGENLSYEQLAKDLIKQFGNESSQIILLDKGVKSKFYLNSEKLDTLLKKYNL